MKTKFLSYFMAVVMLLGSFSGFAFPKTVHAADVTPIGEVTLTPKTAGKPLMILKAAPSATDFTHDYVAYTKNGKEWPAYCVQPNKPGVGGNWSYQVAASTLTENPQVYGAISNGHPFKTPAELGVKDTYEAYYITKMAIWSIVYPNYSDPDKFAANGPENEHVYQAYKKLLDKAKATSSISNVSITAEQTSYNETETEQVTTYTVKTSTGEAFTGNYEISLVGEVPTGTKTEKNGDTFKVIVPISSIRANSQGTFEVQLKASAGSGNALVYSGVPTLQADKRQNYAMAYEADLGGSGIVKYQNLTRQDEPGDGQLRIVKLAAGTTIPLAGAEIKLTKADGGVIGIKYTNNNGEVFFDNLDPGTYYVEEITAPQGYLLDINSHKDIVIIADQPQQTVTFVNEETPKLKILKVDAKTGKPVPGTVFEVSLDGGSETYTVVTESNGYANLGNYNILKPGTYKVKEVFVPDPYILDTTERTVKLEPGSTESITFKNDKKSTWRITKYIEGTDEPLHGAEFAVYKKGNPGALVWSGLVPGGSFMYNGTVEPGWYTFEEISAPRGYLIVEKTKDVYIEADTHVEVKFDNRPRPELLIIKTDDKGNPLPNALFQIKKADGATIFEKWTDENGKILITFDDDEIQLEEGVYSVKEIKAPDGYFMDEDCHKDVTLEWGQRKTLTFVNTKKPSLSILKVDEETMEPLAGAKFKIIRTEDETIKEAITDSKGRIELTDLEPGIYSIDEIVAPHGYLLDAQHKDIELNPGDNKELIWTNKAKPRLRIQKVDANTGELLRNSEFRVTKVEDKTVSEYILENGEIILSNLDEAIYRAEEFQAPEGYVIVQSTKEIMTEWGKTKTLKFDNIRKPVVMFKKTNPLTGKGIAGAKFKVEFEMPGGGIKTIGSFTTDANGRITIPKAEPGWYIFTETMPAPGYSMPSNPVTRQYFAPGDNAYLPSTESFYANSRTGVYASGYAPNDGTTEGGEDTGAGNVALGESGDEIVNLANVEVHYGGEYYVEGEGFNWPTNSIVLKKADANTGELLAGAHIELYRADEQVSGQPGTQIGRYVTDNSGVVVVVGLDPGYYVAKEVQAPPNYVLAETSLQNGFLKADGTSVVEFTFQNFPYGSIMITKIDGVTGEPLANARFKVTDSAGAAVGNTTGEFTTDSRGEILIENVAPGSYVATEIQAPSNYVINTTPKTVQVGTDGKTYKLSFDNYPYGSILISKVDGVTGEPLAGATFKVTDNAGKVVGNTTGEYTTDSRGEILIENVAPDSYIVTEIKAPDNYAINTTPKTVQVGTDGKIYKVSFDNYPYGAILISKVDALTGEPLANARFKVTDNSGKAVGNTNGEYTTDSHGEILISDVAPGSYVVTEIQAPENYAINTTPKTIEVGTDGKTYKLEFDNYPYATIVIKKLDTDTKEPLSGAEFKVTTSGGDVVGTGNGYYTTDATGTITIPNLPKDSYIIEETKAPTGYILENQTKTIAVDYGKTYTQEFFNTKKSSLQIVKLDSQTKQPLKDAKFNIYKMNGELLGQYTTNSEGLIILDTLENGWYKVSEYQAPDGYLLDNTPQDVEIKGNQFMKLIFENQPKASLIIKKFDATTKEPLMGAKFKITKKSSDIIGEYTTNANGMIQIDKLEPGWYSAVEVTAPNGYKLYEMAQDFEIVHTKTVTLEFPNEKLTSLIIKKIDEKTGAPLAGARFYVERQNGLHVGEYTTDKDGLINLPTLTPDWYVVREIKAPDGYYLDETPKTVEVKTETPTVITFSNKKLTGIEIKKIDEKTGAALAGAEFTVTKQNGERIGDTYTTDGSGFVNVPLLDPDYYIVTEVKAPENYILDNTPKTVQVKTDAPTLVTFTNKYKSGMQIIKVDAATGEPLPGAKFTVYKKSGDIIGDYVTDKNGVIIIDSLENGWYKIAETKAPDGYMIVEEPKDVEITGNQFLKIVFENKKLAALQIKKIDEVTGAPLPGARFVIEKQNGEKIYTTENGTEFVTDGQGFINIPNLAPDYYVVREVKQPQGYILDETPKTVQVKTDTPTVVTFSNKPLAGLQIKKINSVTRQPIEGVEFAVSKMNGEKIGNFKTGKDGLIYISNLDNGYYTVTEVKAADGYFIDSEPKTVEVKSGKSAVLEVENQPASGLLIVKTDAKTGQPLKGVVFDVRKADGQRVMSNILDQNQPNTPNNSPNKNTMPNGDISGSYVTDANGRILINTLEPGEYHVVETKALEGYVLDTDVHTVTVLPGKQASLQLTNTPMSGLRILKIDSVTKKGIYDVEFRVYDFVTNKEVGGPYRTDNNGVIDFSGILPEGRYTLVETREAPGYLRDTLPRTVEFKAGKTLDVIWENTPQMGQVQVMKKSASDNEVNGLPAGTPLAGATFEIYHYKTGNLMDQFTTGNNGVGVSKPLPTGRYILKEVVAPRYYKLNDKEIDFEIEFSSQIVKFEVTNEPANTGVSIKKVGPAETMSGQQIRYDFKVIQNTSTVPLTDFYFRDIIPGNVLRVDKIVTGTYNQSLKYKIMFKTNKNDYRVMADNLSTTHNNVVDASPASLGLFSDEYVTEIMFVFGNVKAGFSLVENPAIYATVKSGFPKGFQFANKADIGGKYQNEWIIGNTTWVTTIFSSQPDKLPRTGW